MALILPPEFNQTDHVVIDALADQYSLGANAHVLHGYMAIVVFSTHAGDASWAMVDRLFDVPLSQRLGTLELMKLQLVATTPGAVPRISPLRQPSDPLAGDPDAPLL